MSGEVSIEELRTAVERMHECSATWLEAVPVREKFQGKTVWNGMVHVFAITGHSDASKCYAWSSPMEDSQNRQFFAVLEIPPVKSAADAVRAAIVRMQRFASRLN